MSPKPWEFQPGVDTAQTFQAFAWFLCLPPPRRLTLLAGQFQVSIQTIRNWARDGLWFERARAYDADLLHARKAELDAVYQKSGAEVAQQQLELIALKNAIVGDQLDKLARRCFDTDIPVMRAGDVIRLRSEAFKEERLVRGQATEITSEELDLSKLTDEELEAYDQLTRKARRDGTG